MLRLFIGFLFASAVHAQAPAPRPFKVVRLDPALDTILSTDAKIEILGEHFGLTEGPVWIQDPAGGYLLFQRLRRERDLNVIYKWMAGKPLSVYLEKSGYTGTDTLTESIGSRTARSPCSIAIRTGRASFPTASPFLPMKNIST